LHEWQANSLAAVLLMPREEVKRAMNRGYKPFMPTLFGNRFTSLDYRKIRDLSDKFETSITAMILRLKELSYIAHRPESEFCDPHDILAELGD
jgi:Zn-dependent peptidase ImmA (M78 family)